MATAMQPIEPDLGIVHDRHHFATRRGAVSIDEIMPHVEVHQIDNLIERYRRDPGFTLEDVDVDLWRIDDGTPVLEAISLFAHQRG